MKIKTRQRVLLLLITFFLISVLTLFLGANITKADSFRLEGTALKAEYLTGETVEIPDIYFTTSGGEVKATKTIVCPDGNAFDKDTMVLDLSGLYTVEYYAKSGDEVYFKETSFKAYRPYYQTVGSDASSVEYKAYKNTPNNKALNVKLDAKGQFVCNEMIDVTNLGSDNKLISLYMTPENPGTIEFEILKIRLTDAYDDRNYVEVFAHASTDGIRHGVTYVYAGATSQRAGGFTSRDGEFYSAGTYGTPTKFNFWAVNYYGLGQGDGSWSESYLVNNKFQLFFNYEEKTMETLFHSDNNRIVIADFDDPTLFTNVWEGFTTGEVILSVSASSFSSGYANFAIDYLAGKPINALKVVDGEAPVITVNQTGNVPKAVTNLAYPVFGAEAFDRVDGKVSVVTKVYRTIGANKVECNIADGAFIPTITGSYVIEYVAKDSSGNVALKTINVECVQKTQDISVVINDGEKITSANTGNKVSLASATVTGGSGSSKITVSVIGPDDKAVDVIDNAFRPIKAGVYTVNYNTSDYLGQEGTGSYQITVTDLGAPVFQEKPTFLKYYMSEREYVLPEYVAYEYSGGSQTKVEVAIEVNDEGGTRILSADRKVVFKESTVGTATVTYKASDTVVETFNLKVLSVSGTAGGQTIAFDMSKYFYPLSNANLSAEVITVGDSSTTKLTANESGRFEFINTLLTDSFEIEFSVDSTKTAFSKINLYLIDSVDSTKIVKFTYRSISSSQAVYSINGGNEYAVGAGFTFSGNAYKLVLSEALGKVSSDGLSWITLATFADGTEFNGFPSDKAYLQIELEGVTAQSAIHVHAINSQVMRLVAMDRVVPNIVIPNVDDTSKQKDDFIVIKPAIAGDVIDQFPIVTLQVKKPNGQFASAEDGTLLKGVPADREYLLKLSEYGGYVITYYAKDFSNRQATKAINVNIRDNVAPIIQLEKENVASVSVGSAIWVSSATYSDNISGGENIRTMIFVITPTGKAIQLNETAFIANEIGNYCIRYMAYDEEGNLAIKEDVVEVFGQEKESSTVVEPPQNNSGAIFIIIGVSVVIVVAVAVAIVLIIKKKGAKV